MPVGALLGANAPGLDRYPLMARVPRLQPPRGYHSVFVGISGNAS